jgi:hypothetical protein
MPATDPARFLDDHSNRERGMGNNDELAIQVAKRKARQATSSCLIPVADDLTHILIEAGKNNYSDAAIRRSKGRSFSHRTKLVRTIGFPRIDFSVAFSARWNLAAEFGEPIVFLRLGWVRIVASNFLAK